MILPPRFTPVLRGQPAMGCQRGSITLIGLMLVSVMTLLGAALYSLSTYEHRLVLEDLQDAQAFHAAEAGLYRAHRDPADGDGTNDFSTVFGGQPSRAREASPIRTRPSGAADTRLSPLPWLYLRRTRSP